MYFDPGLWFMAPVGLVISVLGMSSGISSSNFWIPVFAFGLGVEPRVGFWLSLSIMIFGYGSGIVKNIRSKTIHWRLAAAYLAVTAPAAAVGGVLSAQAPQKLLLGLFAGFVLVYGASMVFRESRRRAGENHLEGRHERVYRVLGGFAGFTHGLVATGLGKLMLPKLLHDRRFHHHAEAVGTMVTILFVTTLAAVLARLNGSFAQTLTKEAPRIVSILIWVVPAVIVGGQIGPAAARRLPKRYVKLYVGALLLLVGLIMMARAFS